ncbi:rhodanese-like domain-containing protein [Mangrovimonas spongiae]|uniref:Rhodanese-like domain-containing protein n=1 Tax=Mangrovimonas spongiae TaxID=2494697 RepID=A0A428JYE6_9FLAO|nr:rhodanese-like domain-containing protein [Mangrovimonas spongiae]RSK39154.1 rhodanese-like domain-containing protein [Mangrovimonas spongiae]
MKKSAFVLVLLSIVAMSCISRSENVNVVSSEEMQTLLDMDDVQLVDVRTPEEYKEGYIDHAQNIDYYSDTFEEDILELDKTKPVIVYCKSGGRSAKCAEKLIKAGFVKVYDLDGGISQWKHEGHQVTVK